MEASVPVFWHYVAVALLVLWALVFRLRHTWRSHIAVFLILGWAAAMFSWSVSLDPAVGKISGRVVDARNGAPVVRARVYMPDGSGFVRTRDDGTFLLPGVLTGKAVRVTVRARGYETSYDEVRVTEGRETAGMRFRMTRRVPTFNLYTSERVFRLNERPSVHVSGALVEQIAIRVYALHRDRDRAAASSPVTRQALGRACEARGKSLYDATWTTPLDADGDFSGSMRLPVLAPGLYLLRARAVGGSLCRTSTFLVTDLGVVTRRSPRELLIYAQRFSTGKPAGSVSLSFLGAGREVRRVTTAADGTFMWKAPPADAMVVVASQGEHRAWTSLDSLSDSDVARSWRIYVYTERPIYRPGHEVCFRGIVRRDRDRAYSVTSGQRVRVRVSDAQNNPIFERDLATDAFGCFDGRFTLPARLSPGDCTLEATVGASSGRAEFRASEYRKPEYQVEVKAEKSRYISGETVRMRVDARYFFGAPVTAARVRYMVFESYYGWEGVRYQDLDAESAPEHYGGLLAEGKLKTDAQGSAWLEFPSGRADHDRSFWVSVEVEDSSHRTVTTSAEVLVTMGDFHLEASTDRWGYEPGQKIALDVQSRDYDNKPRAGVAVTVEMLRRTYEEVTDDGVVHMVAREATVWKGGAVTSPGGRASLAPPSQPDGTYVVRVSARDGSGNEITCWRTFFVSGGSGGVTYSGRELTVMLDRPSYAPGATARAVIATTAPEAWVLLTVDGRRIYSHQVVHVRNRAATVRIPVSARYFPNVTVSATLIHDKQLYSEQKPLVIRSASRQVRMSLRPERKNYQPGDTVRCQARITDADGSPVRARFSVGVVDAAIYALLPESTTPIYEFFYGPEPSQVRTEYSFSPDYSGGRSKDQDARVRRNFKDTAWWKADLESGADGLADFEFTLPDNLTTWRLTARAVTQDSRVGETTAEIVSRKPLLVRLEVPRFVVRGDRMEWSAVIHNQTGRPQDVEAEMRVQGGVTLAEAALQKVRVPDGESRRCDWTVDVNTRAGEAVAQVTARGTDAADAMELKVPILTDIVPDMEARAGEADPADRGVFRLGPQVDPAESRITVYLAPSLMGTALQGLDYLATYPYGCTEQTMNAFLPDLHVARALVSLGMAARYRSLQQRLPDMVVKGLDRLYDSQHGDGGWGWWKDDQTHPYLTALVVHGLHQASEGGFRVREASYRRGLEALERMMARDTGEFREASGEVRQRTLWNVRAYGLYVLAEVGRRPLAQAREAAKHSDAMNAYTRALLAMALWRCGDPDGARALLSQVMAEADETATTCHWDTRVLDYSWVENPVEATAAAVRAMLLITPQDPRIPRAVRWLVAWRKGDHWGSTRDTGTVIAVLTDYVLARGGESGTDFVARVRVNGTVVGNVSMHPQGQESSQVVHVPSALLREGDNEIEVRRIGQGSLYWSAQLMAAPRSGEVEARDHGFKVTRTYGLLSVKTGADGKPAIIETPLADGATVPLGSRVRVHLRVAHEKPYPYVMIEDRIPPGFEPSLPEAERNRRGWYVGREFHDDRVCFFATRMEAGTQEISYELFAEAAGSYRVRPAEAVLMYTPEVRGASAPSHLRVKGEDGG